MIELLVVIGIIALLIGILLPVLNRARRAAQTVACVANLRSIGQALVNYATENKGWLPGSGWTSGAQFWNFSKVPPAANTFAVTSCPTINESNDWIGPLARYMGAVDTSIDGTNSSARYSLYRNLQWMICPAYRDFLVSAGSSSTVDAGSGQGLSYCLTLSFLEKPRSAAGPETVLAGQTQLNGNLILPMDTANSAAVVALPNGYGPQLAKIENAAQKVFAADGARCVLPGGSPRTLQPPTYLISGDPSKTDWDSTSYVDFGAFGGYSHSYCRTAVTNNASVFPAQDPRVWAYRHGTLTPFASAGSYRLNVVYFDGHAETLDDVTAANPALWMPTGSAIVPGEAVGGSVVAGTKTVWADVMARYCPGVSGSQTWTSP